MESLFDAAARCLASSEIEAKLHLTRQTAQAWQDGQLVLQSPGKPEPVAEPGRPAKPVLVAPVDVPKRRLTT